MISVQVKENSVTLASEDTSFGFWYPNRETPLLPTCVLSITVV